MKEDTNKPKSAQPPQQGPLIFVADDDNVMRFSLTKYLEAKGFAVKAFADGVDVLIALEKSEPRLIVSDIRMDKLDGITLLKALKSRLETRDIPVVFMSAFADEQLMNQARELGAAYFLPKPFPMATLHTLIRKILKM